MSARSLTDLAIAETIALHEFFNDWLGKVDGGGCDFGECAGALAADFRMIGPDGEIMAEPDISNWLLNERGTRADGFHITVREPRGVWQDGDAAIIEYIEEQVRHGVTTRRLSSALFTRNPEAPRGVVWRHLQETWLQAPA